MRIARIILLFYVSLLSIFITIGAASQTLETGNPLVFLLFLPVVIHFGLVVFRPNKGHKLLLYYDFIIVNIMAISGFLGATNTAELISAALFIPLAAYFWILVLPKRGKKLDQDFVEAKTEEKAPEVVSETKEEPTIEKDFDMDRRTFIKLVGSVGVGVFFLSLFTKKVENTFFGNANVGALPEGTTQNAATAVSDSTLGYKISEIDDSNPTYFGYIDRTGRWYIMKETDTGSFRYARGEENFTKNWKNRANLVYGLYDSAF